MIEGHEVECECVECEMARHEQDAQREREFEALERLANENGHDTEGETASGEIKPPAVTDEDIPF